MFYFILRLVGLILQTIDFLIVSFIAFISAFLPKTITKHYMHSLFQLFCWSFMRFIGKSPRIHQKYSPPLPKRFILIANHPSGYDILALNALFKVTPLAQSGVRKWFILGRIAEAIGTVFVVREDKNSRNTAKEACLKAIGQGKNVLIYPEGGCARYLRPFKYGAFDISLQTGIPILPVYLQYEAEDSYVWGWDDGILRHLFKLFTAINKQAHCYIYPPFYPENFKDAKSYAEYVHRVYAKWELKYSMPNPANVIADFPYV